MLDTARGALGPTLNQMRAIGATAPYELRGELRDLSVPRLLERCSSYRPAQRRDIVSCTKRALRMLAQRAVGLEEEVKEIDRILKPLLTETAPALLAVTGVGTDVGTAFRVAVGDNPERITSEATFTHFCGVSPIDASSGKNQRHRLNRGGDRSANSAFWHIVFTRTVNEPRTRYYIERRMKEGRRRCAA